MPRQFRGGVICAGVRPLVDIHQSPLPRTASSAARVSANDPTRRQGEPARGLNQSTTPGAVGELGTVPSDGREEGSWHLERVDWVGATHGWIGTGGRVNGRVDYFLSTRSTRYRLRPGTPSGTTGHPLGVCPVCPGTWGGTSFSAFSKANSGCVSRLSRKCPGTCPGTCQIFRHVSGVARWSQTRSPFSPARPAPISPSTARVKAFLLASWFAPGFARS